MFWMFVDVRIYMPLLVSQDVCMWKEGVLNHMGINSDFELNDLKRHPESRCESSP